MCKDDPEFIKHVMEEFEEGVSAEHIREEYATFKTIEEASGSKPKERSRG